MDEEMSGSSAATLKDTKQRCRGAGLANAYVFFAGITWLLIAANIFIAAMHRGMIVVRENGEFLLRHSTSILPIDQKAGLFLYVFQWICIAVVFSVGFGGWMSARVLGTGEPKKLIERDDPRIHVVSRLMYRTGKLSFAVSIAYLLLAVITTVFL
jgi:hypothetical protein